MADKQTETDIVWEWVTVSDLVTQVGEPVASAVQLNFKDAIDAIIDYGQAKDGDVISVSSEPSEPSTVEITLSDISSTESGVNWDVVDTTGVPELTTSNSYESESAELYNCYKVDGSVSSPMYRLPDGKVVEVVKEYVLYTAYAPSPEPEPVPDLPPLFRISHQQLVGM